MATMSIRRSQPPMPMPTFRPGVWTDPKMLAKGKEIFTAKCALCHGEKGDGKGPGSVNLPLKPADLTDGKMVAEMADNFWMWRVSEGGLVEPFKSKGSVMPAWKGELSMEDRWAVIAYAHTLSGHKGPHVASEHPELKPKPKFVTGEGTVIALRPEKQQIVLEHGEIKGFMEAMTMGYKTNPTSLHEHGQAGGQGSLHHRHRRARDHQDRQTEGLMRARTIHMEVSTGPCSTGCRFADAGGVCRLSARAAGHQPPGASGGDRCA